VLCFKQPFGLPKAVEGWCHREITPTNAESYAQAKVMDDASYVATKLCGLGL